MKEKKRQKIESLVIFCVFSEIGIQYFDSIIIHLGFLINRSVENIKLKLYYSGIDKGASPYRGHGQNNALVELFADICKDLQENRLKC